MLTVMSKKSKKKSKKGNGSINVWKDTVSMGLGFPKKVRMMHKYHETVTITSNVGAVGFYKFACNGMYDPNLTGTGHQPYYFDQMTNVYNHYTVLKSRILIHVTTAYGVSSSTAYYVTLSQNDDTTQTANSIDSTAEQSSGKVVLVAAEAIVPLSLSNSWSATATFGGDPLPNDQLQGSAAANPSELTVWSIGLQVCDVASSLTCFVEVQIEFEAMWDEIKDIVGS